MKFAQNVQAVMLYGASLHQTATGNSSTGKDLAKQAEKDHPAQWSYFGIIEMSHMPDQKPMGFCPDV